jgi:hypothetical protein
MHETGNLNLNGPCSVPEIWISMILFDGTERFFNLLCSKPRYQSSAASSITDLVSASFRMPDVGKNVEYMQVHETIRFQTLNQIACRVRKLST